MGHRLIEECLIVPASFYELFVELREIVLLLAVLSDQLDQFRTYRQGGMIELCDLLFSGLTASVCAGAEKREKFFNVSNLGEYLGFGLCVALELFGRGIL